MRVSLVDVWGTSINFVRREAHLLVPLTLALLAIGRVGTDFAASAMKDGAFSAAAIILLALGTVMTVSCLGAIRALALEPERSVAEAVTLGFRRSPKILALWLALTLALFVVMAPLYPYLKGGAGGQAAGNPPVLLALLGLFGLFGYFYLTARLFCYSAIIIDRNPPVAEAIGLSWRLTRQHHVALAGLLFLFQLMTELVGMSVTGLVSTLVAPLGRMLGDGAMAGMIATLAAAMVTSLLALILAVFSAFYYRKTLVAQ